LGVRQGIIRRRTMKTRSDKEDLTSVQKTVMFKSNEQGGKMNDVWVFVIAAVSYVAGSTFTAFLGSKRKPEPPKMRTVNERLFRCRLYNTAFHRKTLTGKNTLLTAAAMDIYRRILTDVMPYIEFERGSDGTEEYLEGTFRFIPTSHRKHTGVYSQNVQGGLPLGYDIDGPLEAGPLFVKVFRGKRE
jgi:hypothetical protein